MRVITYFKKRESSAKRAKVKDRGKRSFWLASLVLGLFIFFSFASNSFGMQHYQAVDFSTGVITGSSVNVRQGPGITYKKVTTVRKGEFVRVFAKIGNWYVIQTDSDNIGAVSADYVKSGMSPSGGNTGQTSNTTPSTTPNATEENSTPSTNATDPDGLTADEREVFELINKERTNAGLAALKIDAEVQKVARIKAKDMVDNSYFSHTSPTYGSPFDMLKKYNVSYKAAGENIAGNSSNSAAVKAWMGSERT